MKRLFEWLLKYVDALVALTLAVTVSGLDFVGATSNKVLQDAMLATLAVVTFVLLRDRARGDARGALVQQSVEETQRHLEDLAQHLRCQPAVRAIPGTECFGVLDAAQRVSTKWVFKGATGAYIRSVTLPTCISEARKIRRTLTFRLEILDPTDHNLCERFVRFRQRLATGADSPEHGWTMDGTRRELFATILAACWYQQRYELLDIEVHLSSTFSIFRYELCTTCIIITQRGPAFPATLIKSGTASYDCWESELHVSLQQARSIPLHSVRDLALSGIPTSSEVKALFHQLDLELPQDYDDTDLAQISSMALRRPNPYEPAIAKVC